MLHVFARLTCSSFWRRLWILPLIWVGCLTGVAFAQQAPTGGAAQLPPGSAPTPSIREALNPDGTLRPGINGSFDATGYQLSTGPDGAPVLRTAGVGDVNWDGSFGLPGTNGDVYALAVIGPDVYVGGSFTQAGGVSANYIARWNGSTWSALAGGGTDAPVRALAVAGTTLYVGGDFTVPTAHIATWSGSTWGALGTGINGPVHALAILGTGASVYAGGAFTIAGGGTATNVAHWNGSAWNGLTTFGANGLVRALTFYQNDLYVGGDFLAAGGLAGTNFLARWTPGSLTWSAVGGTLNARVRALAANPGALYVGGDFTIGGGIPSAYAAAWASGWVAMTSGGFSLNAPVFAMKMNAAGTDLYVGGDFTAASTTLNRVARWSSGWFQLLNPSAMPSTVYAMAVGVLPGHLFAGGAFLTADSRTAQHIAEWDATTWRPLGALPLDNTVYEVAEGGTLGVYAGGAFINGGGSVLNHIGSWNGTTWVPMFGPFTAGVDNLVFAIAINGSDVYVGGDFTHAGGIPANHVAKWNGSTWSALGAGVSGRVIALAIGSGRLYVGGQFATPGRNVAVWNISSSTWSALGNGLGTTSNYVAALAVMGNIVFACGDFQRIGPGIAPAPIVNNIAQWVVGSGGPWKRLGAVGAEGIGPSISGGSGRALAISGGDLYVGGFLTMAGALPATRLAKWNVGSATWSAPPVPSPGLWAPTDCIHSLSITSDNQLYANGVFLAGSVPPSYNHIMHLDLNCPSAWTTLGTGHNSAGYGIAATPTEVYAGGAFTAVGDNSKTMHYFGIYHVPPAGPPPPDLTVVAPGTLIPAGTYHDITILGVGEGTISGGDITVTGTLTVSGKLFDGCHIIRGCGALVMTPGARLGICDAAGLTPNPTLAGSVQLTGGRSFSTGGLYEYNGTTAQSTGLGLPSQVRELIANNANTITVTALTSVRRAVRLQGTGTLASGGNLQLLSDAAGTAYVTHPVGGGLTSGNVTVQRYVENTLSLGVGYRHLSSPVALAPMSDLNVGSYVVKVNPAYNTPIPYIAGSIPPLLYPTIFGYDETRGGGSDTTFTDGWYSPATTGSILTPGRGWSAGMAGGLTPDLVGTLNTGPLAATLTETGPFLGPTQKAGWNLLGNPYPEPIDWDLAVIPPGMSGSISVYRTIGGSNGFYLTRAGGAGSMPNGLIGLGQGFFARAIVPAGATFTFDNAMRVESNVVKVYRPALDPRPLLVLALAPAGMATEPAHETTVYVQAGATMGEDALYDGLRPGRNVGVPTLATLIGPGGEAAVNGLPETVLTQPTTVELLAALPTTGAYELRVGHLANFAPTGTVVELLDRLTNTRYDLATQSVVRLAAARAGEVVRGRFALVFNGSRVTALADAAQPAPDGFRLWPNPARGTVQLRSAGAHAAALLDATGRVVREVRLTDGAATLDLAGLAPGMYIVRAGAQLRRLAVE